MRPIHYADHARRQAASPAVRSASAGRTVRSYNASMTLQKKLRRPSSQCRRPALLHGQHAAGSSAGTCGPAVGRAVWMPPPPLAGAAAARVPGPLTDGCIPLAEAHPCSRPAPCTHTVFAVHHHALGRLQKPSCIYIYACTETRDPDLVMAWLLNITLRRQHQQEHWHSADLSQGQIINKCPILQC